MTQAQRIAAAEQAMKWYVEQNSTSQTKVKQALHATGAYTTKGTLKRAPSANG